MENHIYQKFDSELSTLNNAFMQLGGLVETQLQLVMALLENSDSSSFESMQANEIIIDSKEIAIDDDCARIIALRQPAASDLRLILSISRSVRDLERIGDEAMMVAEMLLSIQNDNKVRIGINSMRMVATHVTETLSKVLNAVSKYDAAQAIDLIHINREVDEKFQSATREMITYMMEDASCISHVLNVLWALRSLERIGDHLSNLAEQLIYSVEGVDVRHKSVKQMRKTLNKLNPS